MRNEDFDTIVIGAGQAGLAAGYYLAQEGRRFIVLDTEQRVGDVWRRRWDSLRLFTPAKHDGLPGLPFPGEPGHLPDRLEVAAYLERYAAHYELPVQLGTRVERLMRRDRGFGVTTDEGRELTARSVIVATGAYHRPHVPGFAAELVAVAKQLHSSEYRNPTQLPAGDVLVVGAGNSGAQIATELAATRHVFLSGRSTGHLPRRVLGRDVYDWLWPTIMQPTRKSWLGRHLMNGRLFAGDPLVGLTAKDIESSGVERVGRTIEARDGLPVLEDRRPLDVASVIWCTGFRPAFEWIDLPVFGSDGYPRHLRGLVAEAPGLAFLGLRFQHRVSSSLLGGVGRDAEFVVGQLTGEGHGTKSLEA